MILVYWYVTTTDVSLLQFPTVSNFTINIGNFQQVQKGGTTYNCVCSQDEYIGDANMPLFTKKSLDEFNIWLTESPFQPVKAKYNWQNNTVSILTNLGRSFKFETFGNEWTSQQCNDAINQLGLSDKPILVLPSDLASTLKSQASNVSDILIDDAFIYPVATETLNNNSENVTVPQKYMLLVPILFNKIDEGDPQLIEFMRSGWNAENPDRPLPATILFNSSFDFFNEFKEYILSKQLIFM